MTRIARMILTVAALATLTTAASHADSVRHLRSEGSTRSVTVADPSGQLLVEWHYEENAGDFRRDDGDGLWFLTNHSNEATITVYANIGGTYVPVGAGLGTLNLTSRAVRTSENTWAYTDERFNLRSHGPVETFAGLWDFSVSVVLRDGEFVRLEISEPPF